MIGSWRMQGGMAAGNEKLKAEAAAPAKVIAGAALLCPNVFPYRACCALLCVALRCFKAALVALRLSDFPCCPMSPLYRLTSLCRHRGLADLSSFSDKNRPFLSDSGDAWRGAFLGIGQKVGRFCLVLVVRGRGAFLVFGQKQAIFV